MLEAGVLHLVLAGTMSSSRAIKILIRNFPNSVSSYTIAVMTDDITGEEAMGEAEGDSGLSVN